MADLVKVAPDTKTLIFQGREWYEGGTVLIDKNGLSGTITNLVSAGANSSTILVDKDGLAGTTTDVPA